MTNPPTHLEESLRRDIDRIRGKILEMTERNEQALRGALRALLEKNRSLAYSVILRDQYIDELEVELDRLCLEFIVRQQPVARHLRFVYSTIKIIKELERIGDYAESMARQVLKLNGLDIETVRAHFEEIARVSIPMLHDAIQSFIDQNADLARQTMAGEEKADLIRNRINSELRQMQQEGRLSLEIFLALMTIARRFERVADQAKNICEEVLYLCTGEYVKHKGAEAFRILFVDAHNASVSQMAEAIGNGLGLSKFIFSSAGLTPTPVDPRTVSFLAEKGLAISRSFPKTVSQIPNFEYYQVMVALSNDAKQAFPPKPTKTVELEWAIPDPAALTGTEAEIEAAYQKTFDELSSQIRDLTQAIAGGND